MAKDKAIPDGENIGNQDDMIETSEFDKMLPVPLTDRERLELGENVVQKIQTIGEKKEAAKAAADTFKGMISELEKELGLEARTLRIGKVECVVNCEILKNYRHGSVRITRLDTKEVIESRPMTSEERQQGMKF